MTKDLLRVLGAAVVAALIVLGAPELAHRPADAQPVPSVVGPYNVDLGALITNVAAPAGVYNSANQNAYDQNGVLCVFDPTAFPTGSPVVNFSIQGFDAGTQTWTSYVTSQSITASGVNYFYQIGMYPALPPTTPLGPVALPSTMSAVGFPVPRIWRVQEIISGSNGPTVTGKIGCNVLK